ncbi:VacJ family lipoprotein [Thaumasiovibrio sp. DFM-14]|uniref:MlaA family lipoprotein n=1 Tax=Thaumasiovibrio sp. DFM-14 TaxID=3384792 RepID=UPI0039A3B3D9
MRKGLFSIGLALTLVGCASNPETVENSSTVYDPFEGVNRTMWAFNYDYLDPYLVRPVSLAYVNHVPSPMRLGIHNFLANLEEPVNMINSMLVLDGEAAVTHFNRFWINTVFGVAGIIDIASAAEITTPGDREFGDTMGYWGVDHGPYIMYPAYGPSTIRETTGDIVDGFLPMAAYMNFWQGLAKWVFQGMESRAALVQQESILHNSQDPYLFTRESYIQHKNFIASGGVLDDAFYEEDVYLDEFIDEIDGEF